MTTLAEQSRAEATAHSWVCPLKISQSFSTAGYKHKHSKPVEILNISWVQPVGGYSDERHTLTLQLGVCDTWLSVSLSVFCSLRDCCSLVLCVPETTVPQFKILHFLYSLMWDTRHKFKMVGDNFNSTMPLLWFGKMWFEFVKTIENSTVEQNRISKSELECCF